LHGNKTINNITKVTFRKRKSSNIEKSRCHTCKISLYATPHIYLLYL